jgi:hypothetical protein
MTAVAVDPALADGAVTTSDKNKVVNHDPARVHVTLRAGADVGCYFSNSARAVDTLIEFAVSKDHLSKQQESDHEYRRQ